MIGIVLVALLLIWLWVMSVQDSISRWIDDAEIEEEG